MLHAVLYPGVVYNYTKTGVRKDNLGWDKCISVPLVQPDMYSLINQWDQYLEKFSSTQTWDPQCQRYSSIKNMRETITEIRESNVAKQSETGTSNVSPPA